MPDHEPLRRCAHIESIVFDGEAVLFDEQTRTVRHLNRSATHIWEAADGRTEDEIVAMVATALQTSSESVRDDIVHTVREFQSAGLLEP